MTILENLFEIAAFVIFVYLAFYIYKNLKSLKEFSNGMKASFLCDSAAFVYVRGGNITVKVDERFNVTNYTLRLSRFSCRVPPICKEFSGKGFINIYKKGTCVEFKVIE